MIDIIFSVVFSAYTIPVVVVLISIPLVLRKVPPGGYGLRTRKTLSSPDIWYPANRAAGWYLIAASGLSICVITALFAFSTPTHWLWNLETVFTVGPILLAVLASFIYLRRFA